MRQALSDITVVEVGTGVAATWCGKVFADLGAEVVKLEPPEGDPMRADWGAFANLNTNKGSLVLGRSGDSSGELRRVLHDADLVVEAPGLGAPGRLGHRPPRAAGGVPTALYRLSQRFWRNRALRRLRLERPRRAGIHRRAPR